MINTLLIRDINESLKPKWQEFEDEYEEVDEDEHDHTHEFVINSPAHNTPISVTMSMEPNSMMLIAEFDFPLPDNWTVSWEDDYNDEWSEPYDGTNCNTLQIRIYDPR